MPTNSTSAATEIETAFQKVKGPVERWCLFPVKNRRAAHIQTRATAIMVATRRTPAKGKAEPAAKTPAKKSAAGKKGAAGAKLDPDGNEMTPVYYLRQYVGLFFTLLSFAFIAFAGYATQYGFSSANVFLYPGCAIGFVGLALHELRPYKTKAQMTFDPAAVEYRKKEIAEAEKRAKKSK